MFGLKILALVATNMARNRPWLFLKTSNSVTRTNVELQSSNS